LTESRDREFGGNGELSGNGIYVALTLDGTHKPVRFDKNSEDDPDKEDTSGFNKNLLGSIWHDADDASPLSIPKGALRTELETFSQAFMGDIVSFRIQTYTPSRRPGDNPAEWPCIGILLSTRDGDVVLGQWITPEIAQLHDDCRTSWWMSGEISATEGISFLVGRGAPGSMHPPLHVVPGKRKGVAMYACNEKRTRITWWSHREGVRLLLANAGG
jgi:hypothetical protein